MKKRISAALLLFAAAAQGCSTYPLPEEASGASGEDITNLTRCQLGDGVKEEMIRVAELYPYNKQMVYMAMTGQQFADWLRSDRKNFNNIDWNFFTGRGGYAISFYRYTSISIDYSLEGSENNKAGMEISLLRTLVRGSNSFGIGASNDRTRTVKSQWRTFDTFDSLLKRPPSVCDDAPKVVNMLFPSTGLTRVASVVPRFIALNERQNLSTKEDKSIGALADTITYTTKSGFTFKPSFKLPGSTNDLIATDIAPNMDNSRQDQHVITVLVQQSDGKAVPRIDAFGRITNLTPSQARRLDAETGLDRVQQRNAEDALRQIGQNLSRIGQ